MKQSSLLDRVFNIVGSLILLVASSPLFVVIPLLIKLDDPRGPVLYRGRRLGRGKEPFTIFKFRSLKTDAAAALGNDLVGQGHNVETRIGAFLRDTRLDELPQLFNVLRGDMNLVGPRPERQEIYQQHCEAIPGYDLRFSVRPGMIGYSQVFTPHRTYKRLRSLVDYRFTIKNHSTAKDAQLLISALVILSGRLLRRLTRTDHKRTRQRLLAVISGKRYHVVESNEFVVIVRSDQKPICSDFEELDVSILCGRKTIHFDGVCLQSTLGYYTDERDGVKRQKRDTVFLVEKLSPLNEYKFHKYVLQASIG
jgi:lipopolysaccharide/colanic/teichoic acid biosynthesis glycosyltransferase